MVARCLVCLALLGLAVLGSARVTKAGAARFGNHKLQNEVEGQDKQMRVRKSETTYIPRPSGTTTRRYVSRRSRRTTRPPPPSPSPPPSSSSDGDDDDDTLLLLLGLLLPLRKHIHRLQLSTHVVSSMLPLLYCSTGAWTDLVAE